MNTLLDMIAGGAGWSQNDRLLKLTTPAGPEALLAELVSIRSVNPLFPGIDGQEYAGGEARIPQYGGTCAVKRLQGKLQRAACPHDTDKSHMQ